MIEREPRNALMVTERSCGRFSLKMRNRNLADEHHPRTGEHLFAVGLMKRPKEHLRLLGRKSLYFARHRPLGDL